jgi:hypothetical protein
MYFFYTALSIIYGLVVDSMVEMQNAYVWREVTTWRPIRRWESNIKIDPK